MLINYKNQEFFKNSDEENKEGFKWFIDGVNEIINFWKDETENDIEGYQVSSVHGDVLLYVPKDVFINYDENDEEVLTYPTLNRYIINGNPVDMEDSSDLDFIKVLIKYNYNESNFDKLLNKGDMIGVGDLYEDWHVVGFYDDKIKLFKQFYKDVEAIEDKFEEKEDHEETENDIDYLVSKYKNIDNYIIDGYLNFLNGDIVDYDEIVNVLGGLDEHIENMKGEY